MPAGATTAVNETDVKSGTPASIMVGRSGVCEPRVSLVDGQRPHIAGLDQRQRRRRIFERELRLARDHGLHRRAAALVRHVHDVEPEPLLEHLADQVRRRADAGRGVVELAGMRRASAMSSCTDAAGNAGLVISRLEVVPSSAIGAKPFTGS